MRMAD
jgi:hypothetical protein